MCVWDRGYTSGGGRDSWVRGGRFGPVGLHRTGGACVCACARARVCAYVLLSSFVCCVFVCFVCTCVRVYVCAHARVCVFMSGRARVGDSVVVVCGVVWCGVVWFAYRRASMMAGRGPRWRLPSDLCLPLLRVPPPQGKERR